MLRSPVRPLLLLSFVAVCLAPVISYADEAVRRQEVDAGVHIPVLTRAPQLLKAVEPEYPKEALEQKLTGDVTMLVTLGPDGHVTDVQVKTPAGHGFDEAAVAAVKQYLFSPGEIDGAPAAMTIEYTYHFTLKQVEVKPAEPAPPPTATLKGQLIERGSRTRIANATVVCMNCGDAPPTASSDADGRFELVVPGGERTIKVIANGYEPFQTNETLKAGETTEVVYHVWPKGNGFQTVVKAEREKKEVVRRSLDRQEVQTVPGSFGDPVRVLQNFPGVARAPFISGQLIVRGASPDQTLFYMDGVEIPALFHLGGGPSVVNSEFLDKIDFYPGGFGARYGRAIGGAVDIGTRKGASDTWHGTVNINVEDTSVFVEAPVAEGVSVAAAARRSYIDTLLPAVTPLFTRGTGSTLSLLPAYWDYQLRVDVGGKRDAKGDSSFHVMAFGSDDTLKIAATGAGLSQPLTVGTETLFHRVVASWDLHRANSTLSVSPYVGYDLVAITIGPSINLKANRYNAGLREDLSVDLSKSFTFRTGTDLVFYELLGAADIPTFGGLQYVGFPGAEPAAPTQHIEQELQSYDGAVYVEGDIKAGPLTITPGLRASHFYATGQTRYAVEPRLWTTLKLDENTRIKGSVGLYQQPPDATDLEKSPFGNPNLLNEKAFQSSLGIEHHFKGILEDALNIDLTGFYNRRYDNITQPGPTIVNADGTVTDLLTSNSLLGRAYGIELLARHEVTKNFYGWIAYTLSRSEARRKGQTDYGLTQYDQTHILTLIASWKPVPTWEFGARFRYVTGNPKTPVIHDYDIYNVDGNNYSSSTGVFRSTRQPPFQQLDVRIDKYWIFTSWTLDAFVDIQNVYNYPNQEASLYDYRFRTEIPVPGIPFLPIFGVKGTF